MAGIVSSFYVPALRSKKGEHDAVGHISNGAVEAMFPRWVIPPRSQKDVEERRYLDADEYLVKNGRRLGKAWPRPCFIDAKFSLNGFEAAEEDRALNTLFDAAGTSGAIPVPLIDIESTDDAKIGIYRKIVLSTSRSAGIRIDINQMQDDGVDQKISAVLDALDIDPEKCALLLDFEDADLRDDEASADLVEDVHYGRLAAHNWGNVVVQWSSYPARNPAPKNGVKTIARPEIGLWNRLISRNARDKKIIFGDYAADNASFDNDGGARATPHIRYSTRGEWIVAKGDHTAKWKSTMPNVAAMIINSGKFAGEGYSWGDSKLIDIMAGDGPGNATIWRSVNVAHHIEQAVRDVLQDLGMSLPEFSAIRRADQMSMELLP